MLKLKLWLVSTLVFVLMIAATIWIGKTYGQTISFLAYQRNIEDGGIELLDLWSRRRIRLLEDHYGATRNLHWSPDHRMLVVQYYGDGGVIPAGAFYIHNAITGEPVSEAIYGTMLHWRDDSSALIYRFQQQFFQYDLNAQESTLIATLPENTYETQWSPDLQQIAFVQYQPNRPAQLFIADAQMQSLRRLEIPDFTQIWALEWSPDGRWIAVEAQIGEAYVFDLYVIDTTSQVRPQTLLEAPSIYTTYFEWSPNSRQLILVYYRTYQGDLYLATIGEQSTIRQITFDNPVGTSGLTAVWSPDSSFAALSFNDESILYVMNVSTGTFEPIADDLYDYGYGIFTFLP
jgi:dipeptidyl aminopeptidase/acylaminoacyl peptidase